MWQQDTAPSTYNWQDALSYCDNLQLAGYNDWRLPNANEFQSIVDYDQYSPAINTTYFPNAVASLCWSSTTNTYYPYRAWYVYFYYGTVYYSIKSSGNYVRAVRGGQCGSFDTSTTTTTAQSCPTEQIYGEHSEHTELLRYFRDNVLAQTPEEQEIIKLYYQWSPVIVKVMEEDEELKKKVKEMIEGVLGLMKEEAE